MKKLSALTMALVFLVVTGSYGLAQNRERHVISAKAGGVNAVNGEVMVSKAGVEPQLLTAQDDLTSGDTVSTSPGSQAEILLNPGSYLRLGENSIFTMVDNSLDNLLINLVSGGAIIEATGPDDARFQLNIVAGKEKLAIVRSGIYRINVLPQSTQVLVRKGRVLLEDGQQVKGGKTVTLKGGTSIIAKLDKSDTDTFDLWSKQRADTLAKANLKLSNRLLNGYLSNADSWNWAFSARNSWGLWTFSPFSRCYTFLPFYYGWSSPYGSYYGNFFNTYYGPRYGWPTGSNSGGGVIVSNPSSGGRSSGSGSGGGPVTGPTNSGGTLGPGPSMPSMPSPAPVTPRGGDTMARPIERPHPRSPR